MAARRVAAPSHDVGPHARRVEQLRPAEEVHADRSQLALVRREATAADSRARCWVRVERSARPSRMMFSIVCVEPATHQSFVCLVHEVASPIEVHGEATRPGAWSQAEDRDLRVGDVASPLAMGSAPCGPLCRQGRPRRPPRPGAAAGWARPPGAPASAARRRVAPRRRREQDVVARIAARARETSRPCPHDASPCTMPRR